VETRWIAFAPALPQSQAGTNNFEREPRLIYRFKQTNGRPDMEFLLAGIPNYLLEFIRHPDEWQCDD
jgi:hypothetical protein